MLLCIILHASYNAASGLLLLVLDEALQGSSYQTLLILMTAVLIASVVGLLIATRGQLGVPPHPHRYVKVAAEYKDDILSLTLPKFNEPKEKAVKVKVA